MAQEHTQGGEEMHLVTLTCTAKVNNSCNSFPVDTKTLKDMHRQRPAHTDTYSDKDIHRQRHAKTFTNTRTAKAIQIVMVHH